MKTTEFIVENSVIAQEADDMHRDHEVQMARSQMYSAAQAAIEIHRLLRDISEMEGLEGWVQSKLTLASQYLESVRDYMKYEAVSQQPEMTVFAEDAAAYALDKLLVEKTLKSKRVKEANVAPTIGGVSEANVSPTIGGVSQTANDDGTTTTNYNQGPMSASSTNRPTGTVQTATYDMGPTGSVSTATGPMFGGAQGKGNQISSVTNAQGQTTSIVGKPGAQDINQALNEKNKKLKETASAGASGASGIATSMAGPAGKPGTGKPKKIANAHKPKKINVGKGVY
jgi:hypothetical protein